MQQRFDALSTRLAKSYAAVPIEKGLEEIAQAGAAVRAESRRVGGWRRKKAWSGGDPPLGARPNVLVSGVAYPASVLFS